METETVMATLAAYLETLSSFSPETVADACQAYRRRATRFPPTAGEIYDRCAEIADKAAKDQRLKLGAPKSDKPTKSPEERERVQARYQSLMSELLSHSDGDGYVPSGRTNPVAERRRASEWLERHGPGSNHEVKKVINISPDLEASLRRTFPQNFEAA